EGGRLEALAARIARPFQAGMDRLRDAYVAVLRVGLRHRALVLGVAALSFVAGLAGLRSAGTDLLPRTDSGAFTITLETPSGTSLAGTARVVGEVERLVAEHPEVVLVQAQAGFEPGMTSTGGGGVMGPTQGFLSVTLTPRTARSRSVWDVQAAVRGQIAGVPG